MIKVAFVVKTLKPYRIPFFHLLQKNQEINSVFIFDKPPEDYEKLLLLQNPIIYKTLRAFKLPSKLFLQKRYIRYFPLNLLNILNKFKPVIVFSPEYSIHTLQIVLYKYFYKTKIVIWSSLTKNDERISLPFQSNYRDFLRKRADAFVCYSHHSKEYLKSKNISEDKIFLVENCTDVNYYLENYNRQSRKNSIKYFNLLYVGALEEEKGILDLFEALELLKEYRWNLTIAGKGNLKGVLFELAEKKFKSRINFTGEVKRNELLKIYSESDILVFPSHSDVWGHVIDEAMASGCCVIASDQTISALELIVQDKNGILYKAKEIDALKNELVKLFKHPNLINELGKEAHLTMLKHNESASIQGIKKAINYVF